MVRTFLGILSLVFLIISCDVIDGDVREFTPDPGDTTDPGDTSGSDDFDFTRRVLLNEFTGHKCGNCPAAAETGAQIEGRYGSLVPIIAAHVGILAFPSPPAAPSFTTEFRTETGNIIDQKFGASNSGIPWGAINNLEINGSVLVKPEAWPGEVEAILNQSSEVNVGVKATFTLDQDQIKGNFSCNFREADSRIVSLGAYVTENDIIDWQKDYRNTPTDSDSYNHKHALRGSFYPAGNPSALPWGLPVNSDPNIAAGAEFSSNMIFDISSESNKDNLNMIVFVMDASTNEILQVKEYHLKDFIE